MDFQGGRYYRRHGFTGEAPYLKSLMVCRNREPRLKNNCRRCEGQVRLSVKVENCKIEIYGDQVTDYKPHSEW